MVEEPPTSMNEVAELMRKNLPGEMSPSDFGRQMAWGRGSEEALKRMTTVTVNELRGIGLTSETAKHWVIAYEAVVQLMPKNPSAEGRAALMRHAAGLLSGA